MFKKHLLLLAVTAALFTMIVIPVHAEEIQVDAAEEFCLSADDFTAQESDTGIFLTDVPSGSIAAITCNGRTLRAGDALTLEMLNQLVLDSRSTTQQTASIQYYTIADHNVSGSKTLKFSILPKKNEPPEAEDDELETYRNIPIHGVLEAEDPEQGTLTYQLVTEPKRGTVELQEDGSFTYTPNENKVGKDKFTFTVTDDAGQVSEPAEISIEILKPSDKQTYADMSEDPDAFTAMWMKEQGLFTGCSVGGNLCFEPDAPVSRGEFLVMAMKVVDAGASDGVLQTGFADEAATPLWMQPYIVSALGNGMISGVEHENGLEFRPADQLTHAEAAVMLQNILQLPNNDLQTVGAFEESSTIPAWAAQSAAALSSAGIELEMTSGEETMTRRTAAQVLYQVQCLLDQETLPTFYWVE